MKKKRKTIWKWKIKKFKIDKPNLNLNDIIQFFENNEFLQCANCHKFVRSEENEEDKKKENNKTTVNDQKNPSKQQKYPIPNNFSHFHSLAIINKSQININNIIILIWIWDLTKSIIKLLNFLCKCHKTKKNINNKFLNKSSKMSDLINNNF